MRSHGVSHFFCALAGRGNLHHTQVPLPKSCQDIGFPRRYSQNLSNEPDSAALKTGAVGSGAVAQSWGALPVVDGHYVRESEMQLRQARLFGFGLGGLFQL